MEKGINSACELRFDNSVKIGKLNVNVQREYKNEFKFSDKLYQIFWREITEKTA